MNDQDKNRLTTWKEIAAYLSCDVRTCLRWEKERGLPVHRPEGGSKSRVYAWKDELEIWLKGDAKRTGSQLPPTASVPLSAPESGPNLSEKQAGGLRTGKIRFVHVAAIIPVFAAIGFFGLRALLADRAPADFHINGSELIIVNRAGRTLWKHDTKLENLKPEDAFRPYFNKKSFDSENKVQGLPLIIIRDVDGDGKNEVLFTPHTENTRGEQRVTCFDHDGVERWHFDGGRELTFGKITFSNDYWNRFDVDDFDGDGRKEVLVISGHLPDWPTQMAMLSAEDGKLLGEYWNSGRIFDYLSADLNGDGKKELIIGGTNNEYNRGFLAVLDPNEIGGSSPNTGEFRCPDLPVGREKAYILFPWSDIDPVRTSLSWLSIINLQKNGWIYVVTSLNNLYFLLDPLSLECRSANLSNDFRRLHADEFKAGKVTSVLDEAYKERLRTGLQYWTGSAWTSTPTRIR